MIHIFFVPGMFGSTVEHVLRSFTTEYQPTNAKILANGSMHSYKKEWHPCDILALQNSNILNSKSITTPAYPFKDNHLPEILNVCKDLLVDSESVLIYADSLRSAELNLLFRYYKISTGLKQVFDSFCEPKLQNFRNWNINYNQWSDMQRWELREWFSIFYPSGVAEWSESANQAPDNFLKVSNLDILFDTKNTFLKIINFCNLTYRPASNIDQFIADWQAKQQYIVDEFNLLDQILDHTLNNINFKWNDLNIISESVIQQRLRSKGYEIRCNDLNTFPTDSMTLYKMLEKC